jgi:hypothetical protein
MKSMQLTAPNGHNSLQLLSAKGVERFYFARHWRGVGGMAGAATITNSDGDNEPPAPVVLPGGVHVRLARDEADLRAMVELGRVLHAESRYRDLPVDEARMLAGIPVNSGDRIPVTTNSGDKIPVTVH